MSNGRAEIPSPLRRLLRARVAALLQPRAQDYARAEAALAAGRRDAAALQGRLAGLEAGLAALERRRPFDPEMTVEQAWQRHPGVRAVFARHHLPACDGCAVRFDETLAEAALAYDLALPLLLRDLNDLLAPRGSG